MKRILSVILSLVIILSLAAPVDAAQKPKLNKKKATLTISETVKNPTITLKVKGTKKKAKWSTSNKDIATVKNGKVTAKRQGKVTITCKVNGRKLTCKVTVRKCRHKWNKHWAVYETEVATPYSKGWGRSICKCGVFLSYKEAVNHRPHYEDATDIQISIGLHGMWAKSTHSSDTFYQTDEHGLMVKYWRDKIHTEYVDYIDCTKCGEHVDALDLPAK